MGHDDYGTMEQEKTVTTTSITVSEGKDNKTRTLTRTMSTGTGTAERFEASHYSGRGVGTGSIETHPTVPLSSYTRRQLVSLCCVAYGNFCIAACVSLQAPFFPHEAEQKGASATIYGLVFGIYELLILVMSPIFGKFITFCCPNLLVDLGLFLCGFSTVIFGLLDQLPDGLPFISAAFLVRIFEGIGAAAFLTASYTIMASEFPHRVATLFALLETCFGVGLIVGPTVGGGLYQIGGYSVPFIVLGSFLLIGCVVTFLFLPRSGCAKKEKRHGIMAFLFDCSTLLDAFATASALNFIGFNAATFEPHIRSFNLTPFFTGCIFILTGAVYAVTSPIMGRICETGLMKEKSLVLTGSVLVLIGSVFLGPAPFIPMQPQLWLIITSLLVIGLGLSGKLVGSFVSCINHSIKVRGYPDHISTYGMVSALFFSSCSVGAFVGPTLGGWLLDTFQYPITSLYITLIEVVLIILLILSKIMNRCSSNKITSSPVLSGDGDDIENTPSNHTIQSPPSTSYSPVV